MASTEPPPLPIRTQGTEPPPPPPPPTTTPQAGGGTPSSIMGKAPLSSFSPAVMSHLKTSFEALSPDSLSTLQGSSILINTFPSFLTYMASPASSAMGAAKTHDLSYPISNYFISTSHNTYLSGNQLYGEASTSAYKNVLVRGCRCLEIDVWNGEEDASLEEEQSTGKSEKRSSRLGRFASKVKDLDSKAHLRDHLHHSSTGKEAPPEQSHLTQPNIDQMPAPWHSTAQPARIEPRVLHGHTLTKEVSFRSVCETIRDNAFIASTLPVIISLEVHANLQQQEIMVEIMRSTWQGLLVDLEAAQEEKISHLPSPNELRNKILIKVKWSPNPDSKTGESTDPRDHLTTQISDDEEDDDDNKFAPPPTSADLPAKAKKASKILHELSKLGIYTRAYSFKTFSAPEASLPNHVFSLSEAKVQDFCAEGTPHALTVFKHNRNYLMRVFPSGLRVNSSNVEPTFLWRQGAQMVALNWQKWDRGMMLNEGMFAGEEGWVLKPEGYRGTISSTKGDVQGEKSVVRRKNIDVTIELFAGQDLPLPAEKAHASRFHPYVKMQLHVDSKAARSEGTKRSPSDSDSDADDSDIFKRRSKTSRTTQPDFGGEKLHWSNVGGVIEELSFLRVKVQDDRIGTDDLAAWACVRLDKLQSGFRFLHLLDAEGRESAGALLVKITKTVL